MEKKQNSNLGAFIFVALVILLLACVIVLIVDGRIGSLFNSAGTTETVSEQAVKSLDGDRGTVYQLKIDSVNDRWPSRLPTADEQYIQLDLGAGLASGKAGTVLGTTETESHYFSAFIPELPSEVELAAANAGAKLIAIYDANLETGGSVLTICAYQLDMTNGSAENSGNSLWYYFFNNENGNYSSFATGFDSSLVVQYGVTSVWNAGDDVPFIVVRATKAGQATVEQAIREGLSRANLPTCTLGRITMNTENARALVDLIDLAFAPSDNTSSETPS